ncbi:ubiquitin carboxyl-terminal hydrolase isozyme L3 [Zychaea mexicana]|uniref:ubiquitin carboxyl-terminal hydrolase isozyme L3 n=1 Tax=Zychaea mexicana TaxID=64656 RepID=UPI0022FECE22|nr:ubiquitin carboxyl-terminal hydrolase isozyme L3 [Zychaea mexicana]KAI9494662.1 ubiquitin carboxyl-terminal hydrolase isozyme L3 [Zychaea mexicana]
MATENQPDTTTQKPKLKWTPLEANPDVWNKVFHVNGIDKAWSFNDVYGFDPELLSFVPRPVAAMIFLYPITEAAEQFRHEEEARLTKKEQDISPNVMFFKQTISNACGMMALIHALANNKELVGPGLFHDIISKAKHLTPDERADLLEGNELLASVHKLAGDDGQTRPPPLEERIDLHFICFVEVDDHLYELDGRKSFPINHGRCTDLVECSAKVMRKFIERDPGHENYSAIALSKLG